MIRENSYLEICKSFKFKGEYKEHFIKKNGHINDTFLVKCNFNHKYILQRVNTKVFKNPVQLVENIFNVTEHIRKKILKNNDDDILRKVITLLPSISGKNYYIDSDNNFWRAMHYIENSRTYNVAKNKNIVYESAQAFGVFQNYLLDLDSKIIKDVIPDFHNGLLRYDFFLEAMERDNCDRVSQCKKEIDFIMANKLVFTKVPQLIKEKSLPIRLCHNDTKINNVLIDDNTNKAICVIDLDTVMNGVVLFDFGDMVRTATSHAKEDECDLSKVSMDITYFESLVNGYANYSKLFLNKSEIENLVFSSKLMTMIIGMRFLTDFINGDLYFKTSSEFQNLDRARVQFQIVKSINKQENEMYSIIKKYF